MLIHVIVEVARGCIRSRAGSDLHITPEAGAALRGLTLLPDSKELNVDAPSMVVNRAQPSPGPAAREPRSHRRRPNWDRGFLFQTAASSTF
jgi:hypothetical protein